MALKHEAYRRAKVLVGRAGFDLTRRHFYSPIPNGVPERVWHERNPMRGITMDLDAQLTWLAERVGPYSSEFQPPIRLTANYTYVYENASFGHGDADTLYAVVRSLKPRRIVELGSGHSSVVIRLALRGNRDEGHDCAYQAYDPYPTDHLAGSDDPLPVVICGSEDLGDDVFGSLGPGDILFVDTTHTVKIGGDVVRIILDGLPLLAPGVFVHIHDVFLPYAYPRAFFTERELYWAEQYMLQAFLAFNASFEPVVGLHALSRDRRAELGRLIPSALAGNPCSFWLRRL
jgi:hypothetical protein